MYYFSYTICKTSTTWVDLKRTNLCIYSCKLNLKCMSSINYLCLNLSYDTKLRSICQIPNLQYTFVLKYDDHNTTMCGLHGKVNLKVKRCHAIYSIKRKSSPKKVTFSFSILLNMLLYTWMNVFLCWFLRNIKVSIELNWLYIGVTSFYNFKTICIFNKQCSSLKQMVYQSSPK